MSASCKYTYDVRVIKTLTCEFGCCEHGCCIEEKMNKSKVSDAGLGLVIGIPVAFLIFFIIVKVIIYYCRQRRIKRQAALLQQLIEAGRPRPTIIICVESELGRSSPLCGKHELPAAQGPPAYEERTHAQPSFEEATRLSSVSGILGRGNSGYRRFENK